MNIKVKKDTPIVGIMPQNPVIVSKHSFLLKYI